MADEINASAPGASDLGSPPGTPPKSALGVLVGVFFEPQAAFQSLHQRPRWVLPTVLVGVVVALFYVIAIERVGIETFLKMSRRAATQQAQSPEAQEAMRQRLQSPIVKWAICIWTLVSSILTLVVIAGVFTGLFALFGTGGRFKQIFSVTVHAFAAYTLIHVTLQMIVLLLKDDYRGLDISNLVMSNLAFLIDPNTGSRALRTLLGSIDLFSFWLLFLWITGFHAVLPRTNLKLTATIVLMVWAFYVTFKVAIAAIFGG